MHYPVKLLCLFTSTVLVSAAALRPQSAIAEPSLLLAQAASAQTAAPLLQVEGVLEDGDLRFPDNNSLYDIHQFEGQSGQTVTIVMESLEFDPNLTLLNPQIERMGQNDDDHTFGDGNGNAVMTITLPTTGTYAIAAGASSAQSNGKYMLTVLQGTEPRFSDVAQRQAQARSLYQQGRQQANRGEYQSALRLYEQAVAIYQEIGDRRGEGTTFNNMGLAYSGLRNYAQALNYYQQALSRHRAIGNRRGEGITFNNMGSVYTDLEDYQQALNHYQQALNIRREIGDRRGEGVTLNNMSMLYYQLGNYPQALDGHHQALVSFREVGDRNSEGIALNNIGEVYSKQGDYPQALNYYQQSLLIQREVGDRRGEGVTLNNIGLVYGDQGDYPQALNYYQQSLLIRREVGDRRGEGVTLNNIGVVYRSQGDYSQASNYYQQALSIRREMGDRNGEGITLNNIGLVYYYLDNYPQALDYYQQALVILQQINDRNGEGTTLNNIGLTYNYLGDFSQSLTWYQQALRIFSEIGDRNGEGTTLNNIGLVYRKLGDYSQALSYYQQALSIRREIGDRSGESNTLNNIGLVYHYLGDYSQALVYYQQALSIRREIGDRNGEGNTLNNAGGAHRYLGNYPQAADYYQQALVILREIGDRAGEAMVLGNLGDVLGAQDQPELAITFLKQAVNMYESIRGQLTALDRELQNSYTDTIAGTYRRLADLLLAQGRLLEAEQVLELLKVQEIREYTRGQVLDATTRQVTLSPLEAEIVQQYDSIIAFGQQVNDCQQDATCRQSPRWQDLQTQRRALTIEFDAKVAEFSAEVRRRIANGDSIVDVRQLTNIGQDIVNAQPSTVLIYPVVLQDKLWILWITEAGIANSIEVPVGKADIDAAVLEFRRLMRQCEQRSCRTEADIAAIQTVSQRLYNWLFPDLLEAELRNNQTQNLVFALDQSLRYISMAALFDGQNYLIENYTVSTINGASLTNRDRPLSANPEEISVLALGLSEAVPANPAAGLPGFSALDHVPDEISSIVQQADGRTVQGIYPGSTRLNRQFNESAILNAPGHQILHIATHGKFDPVSLDASFLILGTKEPWRISNLRLDRQLFADVSLVVLSACETGLGQDDWSMIDAQANGVELPDGREVSSIAQAFVDAGANTVVASLWQVNDAATSTLMQQFYQALAHDNQEESVAIAQALQQAQLRLLQGDSALQNDDSRSATVLVEDPSVQQQIETSALAHPYYWSSFIIIGNGL
ncbi:tetratricopeptide repeat protein [Leptolyngbya sp. AN02str]|uniref:tetratricopeptide repeat protein n=1 Tax=Leptolyngbya sp. AN02str TaxID=3423363 RepID=UPI003D3218B1